MIDASVPLRYRKKVFREGSVPLRYRKKVLREGSVPLRYHKKVLRESSVPLRHKTGLHGCSANVWDNLQKSKIYCTFAIYLNVGGWG